MAREDLEQAVALGEWELDCDKSCGFDCEGGFIFGFILSLEIPFAAVHAFNNQATDIVEG